MCTSVTRLPVLSLLWASLFAGCGGAEARRGPTSTFDPGTARPQPLVQRLRVVALADDRYRLVPHFARRIGDRIDAASDHMAVRFGLSLELLRVDPWEPEPEIRDSERLLAALEAVDATPGRLAPEADLVIAFTARPPPARASGDDLAYGRYAGRLLVVRSLTPFFEPESEAALHDAEVWTVLRALGLVFGAVPTCGETVMADAPRLGDGPPGAAGWTDLNLALVRAHATLDLRAARARERIPVDVAARSLELLERPPPAVRRCAGERLRERIAMLRTLTRPAPPPPQPEAVPDEVASGLAALAAGDVSAALARCAERAEQAPQSEASRCAGLAAEALGRPDDATRWLRAWLAHHPGDEEVVLALARVVGRDGDDGAARALLEGFVRQNPDSLRARLNLGIAHARLGNFRAARSTWEAVLARDPDNRDARELLKQLPPE